MSTDAKAPSPPQKKGRSDRGILIFTYPKIIFLFPSFVIALICWIGMLASGNHTEINSLTTPEKAITPQAPSAPKNASATPAKTPLPAPPTDATKTTTVQKKFTSPQNMLALLFLMTMAFNLLIIAIDFPRFTVVAFGLFGTTAIFFLLWLGIYVNWLSGLVRMLEGVYVSANANFYLLFAVVLLLLYGVIFISRWLDYWEILPNEILHHHGPWSDLERYPTMNLKFDKEIPDIFEHFMFGAGRLVLRVPSEDKSIVLDNVLHVGKKEMALKQLMSRLEVRVTTDQEVSQET